MMPSSPGDTFAGYRYVSDVLERLLEAREVRATVREHALHQLAEAPEPLRTRLVPVASYVGGKCMGYPAVWFIEGLLAEQRVPAQAIIDRCPVTLSISLTTSIVDDLADRDEQLGHEHLAYLYTLIANAALSDVAGAATPAARDLLYRALDACLNPSAQMTDRAIVRRGNRIGDFFRMIAADALAGLWPRERCEIGIEATGRFGELCAHIDDWMDAERDLAHGVGENVLLVLLKEHLGRAPTVNDLVGNHEWLSDRVSALLVEKVDAIQEMLAPLGMMEIVRRLSAMRGKLPSVLLRAA